MKKPTARFVLFSVIAFYSVIFAVSSPQTFVLFLTTFILVLPIIVAASYLWQKYIDEHWD